MKHVIEESLRRVLRLRDKSDKPLHYLEIGVHYGDTFESVPNSIDGVEVIKEGVDPYGPYDVTHRMSSQVFFALNSMYWKKQFDVIFIDGLHLAPIVIQEIQESFLVLNKEGVLILDDTFPTTQEEAAVDVDSIVEWQKKVSYPRCRDYDPTCADKGYKHAPTIQGDVWKAVAWLRITRPDLKIGSIPPTHRACTLIVKGSQSLLPSVPFEEMGWDYYQENQMEILLPTRLEDILL